jgi:hypothetical protein
MIEVGDKFTDGERVYEIHVQETKKEARRGSRAGETITLKRYILQNVETGRTKSSAGSVERLISHSSLVPVDEEKTLEVEYEKLRSRLGYIGFQKVFPNWNGNWEEDKEEFKEFTERYWNEE